MTDGAGAELIGSWFGTGTTGHGADLHGRRLIGIAAPSRPRVALVRPALGPHRQGGPDDEPTLGDAEPGKACVH